MEKQHTNTQPKQVGKFTPPPFVPFDYQAPIIKKMIKTILNGQSGLVIQPTATGKSVEAAFTSRACILLHNMRGLYLYNENEGLDQARKRFEQIFAGNNIVCANFFGYGRDERANEADMMFASFQSFNSHHKKWYLQFDQAHFDFIIVNEAHHGQAETYKEVIDYFICPKIGMTATPIRMDGKDIRDLFHELIHEMTLEEAIVNGWIAQIEYHILSHGLSTQKLKKICREVVEENKRISLKQLNESIFIELLDQEMLKEVYAYAFSPGHRSRQTLIFCESIAHAKHVLSLLQSDGKSVDVVHSKRTKNQNRTTMDHFRDNKIQFLLSVDKLNEDIDLPNVELGVFLRATDSLTVFLQQMGRLLRKTGIKDKAIILDFVANAERLVLVQQLIDKIQEQYEKKGLPLQKNSIHVSGEGFDFTFSKEIVDVLKMLRAIRSGFYETWQEAGEAALKLGITGASEYERTYKKDLRLPANPITFYSDFPSWNVFLNRKVAPKGWKSIADLGKTIELYHTAGYTLKNFAAEQRVLNPDWVGNFWSENGFSFSEYYHPKLVAKMITEFGGRTPAPEGWMTASMISRLGFSADEAVPAQNTVKEFVVKFRNEKPGWFKNFLSKSAYLEHYHPDLVTLIKNEFSGRKTAPKGWKTTKMIVAEYKEKDKISLKALLSFVSSYRASNPEWFSSYYQQGGIENEHYHPDLIAVISKNIDLFLLPPKGWITFNKISSKQEASKIVKKFRKIHPQWFCNYCVNGKMKEHYHPDLVERINKKLITFQTFAPEGWKTCYQLANEYGTGVKWTRVKDEAYKYKKAHPEWFKDYRASTNMREHYHPDLIAKIHLELEKVLPAPKGWMTPGKLSRSKEVANSFDQIKKFAEQFRNAHPEWFHNYLSGAFFTEYYHPFLVKKIKVKFSKK